MYSDPQRALRAYDKVGMETGVAAADPHQLVLMLFEGALAALRAARRHLQTGEAPGRRVALGKAISIIESGLKASLDVKSGGELARNLFGLYDYMGRRLLHANLHGDAAAVEEVTRLLAELHGAWKSIGARAPAAEGPRP